MNTQEPMRRGQSRAPSAEAAVAEFHAQVAQPGMAAVVFFCSPAYDREALAAALRRHFPDVLVVGCTTAGEIGPLGYTKHSLAGASLAAGSFTVEADLLTDLANFEISAGRDFAKAVAGRLDERSTEAKRFAMLLIDGLSLREEPVTHALQEGLGSIPLFGGSAGDALDFHRTQVFHGGQFHDDAAVLLVVASRPPFRLLRTQHFVPGVERLVVTEVDAAQRIVKEINGRPAVDEYSRLIGVQPQQLTPGHFANWPVVVMIDGTDYVRAIQHAYPDGSLSFYCAIDEGVVLRVAHGVNMLHKTEVAIAELEQELGHISGMLLCECQLRNLEASRTGCKGALSELFQRYRAVGFSTYGEQLCGIHINQTLTGIAFGEAAA